VTIASVGIEADAISILAFGISVHYRGITVSDRVPLSRTGLVPASAFFSFLYRTDRKPDGILKKLA
jgi:hypothetical protein